MKLIIVVMVFIFTACCTAVPSNIKPVSEFEIARYLGQWYEIARLDHRFERGLSKVTANYSLQEDGTVKVINRGYLVKNDKWKEAVGKAKYKEAGSEGYL